MALQVLVLVGILVLATGGGARRGMGKEAGHVTNTLGHALPEEQLGTQPQVLGVFDEAEADHGALAGPELLLQKPKGSSYQRLTQGGEAAGRGWG